MFAVPLPTLEELAKERAERAVAILGRLRSSPVALVAPPAWGTPPDTPIPPPEGEPAHPEEIDRPVAPPQLLALPAPADAGTTDGRSSQPPSAPAAPPPLATATAVEAGGTPPAIEREVPSEATTPVDSTWCTATRADGEPCRARAVPGRGVCIGHGQWRRASGGPRARRSSRGDRALAPVLEQLERALAGLVEGRLDVEQATVAASIGRLLLAAHGSTDLRERLSALEAGLTGRGDPADH